MAKHDIDLEILHGIEVANTDIEVVVREDGEILGRVRISRGTIDWIPRSGRYAKSMRWQKFDRVMAEYGSDRRRVR
jgi:hypothetical protein